MKKVDLNKWEAYFAERNMGFAVEAAAKKARLSFSTAYRFERGEQGSSGLEAAQILGISVVAGNLVDAPISKEALRALVDFAYFRLRYFGRRSRPWQERAAYVVLQQLQEARETMTRRYIVMNEPPGAGKSTLFTHDIPCWLIARDRSIRIMIGSRTERQAKMYVGRIKRTLERDVPLRADTDLVLKGLAEDAEACLATDLGAFKPEARSDKWAANELTVRQVSGVQLDDKEPTASAWGMDSGFLGGRFDLVVWDDLVDRKTTKTQEARENLIELWDSEMETRIEPGGVMILQGQRISADDLYRYCLDKKNEDESPKYIHVMYKAHDEQLCTEDDHEQITEAWPESCLLDPVRLPWKMLASNKRSNPKAYALQYQQEDHRGSSGLVWEEWIEGGVDGDGYPAPGCLDKERSRGIVPDHLKDGKGWSFVTVDPSPTEWWGIIWWVYDPESGNRYIIDIHRRRLSPQDFLSVDMDTGEYSGLLVDIHAEAYAQGAPLSHVIVEINAAQRWLLGQPHVQRWTRSTGVVFVPHTTHVNKADPKYGVESIGDFFRQGRVRIPYQSPSSRLRAADLINELLRYPDGTTDLVMSVWFHTLAVIHHYAPKQRGLYRKDVPKWMSRPNNAPVRRGLPWAG